VKPAPHSPGKNPINVRIGATGLCWQEDAMRADRVLIGAGVVLGVGLWLLFNFCHGNVGVGFALPVAGTKFNMDITTMGVPALIGMPITVIGIILLVAALVLAIVQQFRPVRTIRIETTVPRTPHFEE
jgi:apolipoprotein N-acyltransferase